MELSKELRKLKTKDLRKFVLKRNLLKKKLKLIEKIEKEMFKNLTFNTYSDKFIGNCIFVYTFEVYNKNDLNK